MGKIIRLVKILLLLTFFFYFLNSLNANSNDEIQNARNLFLKGDYQGAIELCEALNTAESLVLQSRIISIYTYFYKNNDEAEKNYLKAYKLAKKAININMNNSETYVEAAHSLGRYGQQIGILSAISMGIADRVKKYLSKALFLDSNNVIANLSLGIWHAEIIDKAGKFIGGGVYGAKSKEARKLFQKTLQLNNNQIGLLYELSYGYYLLGEEMDIEKSKELISKLLKIENYSHMDSLYKIKAQNLLKLLY